MRFLYAVIELEILNDSLVVNMAGFLSLKNQGNVFHLEVHVHEERMDQLFNNLIVSAE